jgi:putative CocE/NonD family hydrolase
MDLFLYKKLFPMKLLISSLFLITMSFTLSTMPGSMENPDDISTVTQTYKVLKETVMIPMRDGIKLSTDLYMPAEVPGKVPVILMRTPTNKSSAGYLPYYFASKGYVVAVQDVRGRFASEGAWEPFITEGEDGYDAIEWLAQQQWCNGKAGMFGGSYMAHAQLLAAVNKPPHLTALIPHNLPADPFRNSPYENGIFLLAPELWWINFIELELDPNDPKALQESQKVKDDPNLSSLPVKNIDRLITGSEVPYFSEWTEHNTFDKYWQKAGYQDKLHELDIPVLLQSGWYDTHSIGTTLAWQELSSSGNRNIRMIMGPWNHANAIPPYPSVRKTGSEALVNLPDIYLEWFDFWLKGDDNRSIDNQAVRLYVMNDFRWIESDKYPLPQTSYKKLYFESTLGANSMKGDGRLIWEPESAKPYDSYIYDPGDPAPAFIYRNSQGRTRSDAIASGRNDILVYESDKLDSAITVVGPVSAKLYASSDCRDTDWFVYLYAVNEKEEYLPVTHGCIRARFRNSLSEPVPLTRNKIYEYRIDMWHTGIKLDKGWKIRVEISSSDFPQYSRNLNTGKNNETENGYRSASQKVYHSAGYQSHILLPVIP